MTLIKKGVSLLEDILMLPPGSCAIASHDDPTDRKGPLLTLVDKYFLQGPVFILLCLIAKINSVCPLIKKGPSLSNNLF